MNLHAIPQFLRFCIVGLFGFLVDAGSLELFVLLGLPAEFARMCSMTLALQSTYTLHARFTFKVAMSTRRETLRAWTKFMIANLTGVVINYLVFLLVLANPTCGEPLLQRQAAVICGTVTALCFNYWTNRRVVFAPRKS